MTFRRRLACALVAVVFAAVAAFATLRALGNDLRAQLTPPVGPT